MRRHRFGSRLALCITASVCFTFCATLCATQAQAAERGTVIRRSTLYVAPDATSARLETVNRGSEAAVIERAPGWVHVIVTLQDERYNPDPEATNQRNLTGWVPDKTYISDQTPKGDEILFGEAADSEDQASSSHGRKGAAGDARRLYYQVYQLFPNSPLAAEALYRAADIQWQLDRADQQTRPSYKSSTPQDRLPIDEQSMRLVHKKFPGTKWDDLASYRLLDNKLCGDWMAASKCPEKEAETYEKYAAEHPASPKAAEALCNAAYRWLALTAIYSGEGDSKKAPEARQRAEAAAQKALEKNNGAEWNARAQRLLYMAQKNLPVYGSGVE